MKRNVNIEILGRMGEKYVANVLTEIGVKIEQAINHFDHTKDMMGDGKSIEVKTQVPFIVENCFTVKPNQMIKCRNIDVLYFISVPAPRNKYRHEGWLFRVDPKSFVTKTRKTKDGRDMILIPIEQDAVIPVQKIEDNIVSEMMKYTVSGY